MADATATLKYLLLGEDRSAGKAFKGVGDDAEKAASKMQRVGHVAGVMLAGGLTAAAAAAYKWSQMAAEDEESAVKMATVFRNAAGATKAQIAATEDWITAQGKAVGVADDELRPALSKLVAVTGDVGKAQRLTSLAMDVSAGTGKDLGAVTMALAKAQNGSVGGLAKLGIATKDATGKTRDLNDIMKDLAKTYRGSAAKAADTVSGKTKKMKLQFDELQETIGYKLLPVMSDLAEAGLKMVDWVDKNQTLVATLAGVLGGLVATVWLVNAAVKAWAAAQVLLNIALSANPIGIIEIAIAALVAGLILAYKKSETFRSIVDGALKVIGTAFTWLWNLIQPLFELWKLQFKAIGTVMQWVWNNLIKPVLTFILYGVQSILTMWGKMLIAMGNVPGFGWAKNLGEKMTDAAGKVQGLIEKLNTVGTKHPRPSVKVNGLNEAIADAWTLKRQLDDLTKRGPVNSVRPGSFGDMLGGGKKPKRRSIGDQFFSGGLALVGERGPELVTLPRGSGISTTGQLRAAARSGGGGDSEAVNLTVVLKAPDGREMQRELLRFRRQGGGSLGLA